jgi:hypothetical protein
MDRSSTAYRQIKAARVQRDAFATQLRVQYGLYRADSNDPATSKRITLNLLLEAHRFWSDALATEYQAIVTYNNALAGWEYAKGSSMAYAHVRFAEEMPSDDEKVRAVEQERDQTREKVRREQAAPVDWSSTAATTDGQALRKGVMVLSLPSLWKTTPPVEKADELPPADGEIDVDKWLHGRVPLK